MSLTPRFFLATVLATGLLTTAGCGGDEEQAPASAKAGAKTLTQAMNRASQAFDDVAATRSSLDRLGQDLVGPISLTGDVIGLLDPNDEAEKLLLTAARQQRTFLQASNQAATSRTRSAAVRAVSRARSAGRMATNSYARVVAADEELAGLVPPVTAFNTSQLRRAVRGAFASGAGGADPKKTSSGGSSGASSGTSGQTDCGDGITAGNSATSCPFARNVAGEWGSNGGGSVVIDVYSPVTGRSYTMSCSGSSPVRCSGGNGALVLIR